MYVRVDNVTFRGCMHEIPFAPVSEASCRSRAATLPESGVYPSKLKVDRAIEPLRKIP
jgi:hypothetical protein